MSLDKTIVKTKHQSNGKHQSPRLKKVWLVQYNVQIVSICISDVNEIVHKESVPPGETMNQEFYLKVLRSLFETLCRK